MTNIAIDNLSRALFVPTVNAQLNPQPRALAQRQPFDTSVTRSRSQVLTAQGLTKGKLVYSILQGISTLITAAKKTALPSNFPETTRVTLQAELTRLLKNLDDVVNSAEVGSISLLRTDARTIRLETTTQGGSIKVNGVALDAKALGLSNINILSNLGLKDAARRVSSALQITPDRLSRLDQLDKAVTNRIDFGILQNSYGNGTSLGSTVAHHIAIGPAGYAPPIQYGSPISGQSGAQAFERGSFINLIG